MTPNQLKITKRGIMFFSILFIIQIAMQTYNFSNGGVFKLDWLFFSFITILLCRLYYPIQNFLKERNLY
ncbi:hypothetical protein ASC84_15390 [Acinetobacter sp. Root1280]|nr:hypothetical protein ASC84_15390 [Acinetobacter sp. Root1280]